MGGSGKARFQSCAKPDNTNIPMVQPFLGFWGWGGGLRFTNFIHHVANLIIPMVLSFRVLGVGVELGRTNVSHHVAI